MPEVSPGRGFRTVAVLTALLLLLPAVWSQVRAIPAFARKYRLSCSTCRAPVPQLRAYGEESPGNSHKLHDREPVRAFYDTGDDLLTLQRQLPVAIRLDSYVRFQTKSLGRRTGVQAPYYLKILSGGQVARNVGHYFYFLLRTR